MTWTVLTLLALCCAGLTSAGKPNIIFILLDDAGWYDFQSHDPLMATPNIDRLRQEGLFLNQSYVLPMCAPTRSAILTGRYPHTFGAQNGKAAGTDKLFWVPETFKLMSDEMKELGYQTHMLGKWHMGFCHPTLTPLYRGFDTFHGFLLGAHSSYYTHFKSKNGPYDWWNNTDIDWSSKGTYNTELLNDAMLNIIQTSKADQPFFVYLAYPAPHGPKEAPQRYINTYCSHFTEDARRIHCAMVAAVDEGIGKMIAALKEKRTYDDTAFIVMSDNGGAIGHGSSNYPQRGGKKTVYEGGTRVYTVLKAPKLSVTNTTYSGMVHAVDWVPTLVHMGGGKAKDWMQGKNAWDRIKNFEDSRRNEFLYTYDDYYKFNHRAYRFKQWKLIQGRPGQSQGWYPPYNLVEDGVATVEDIRGNQNFSYFELYNLDKDPEERKNLANKKPDQVQKVLGIMESFLADYPLQPFVESGTSDAWKDTETNEINTCWCHPEHSVDTPDCPAQ
ncbi:arylsulfatase J-like [Littorina saxatilis]|uniref:Sulfatase N-terminal domain-containing protein n=1 Tax=Littorina saxatilis TaxID=31220 RepID=A0AAN9AZX9_9CAEN